MRTRTTRTAAAEESQVADFAIKVKDAAAQIDRGRYAGTSVSAIGA